MKSKLIAPCGMNCAICLGYLREKNKCPGCRLIDPKKAKTRLRCKIKNCKRLKGNKYRFCYSCKLFPCARMKHLDKRYRTKYGMSMIENLEFIKKNGIRRFLAKEEKRWTCKCGGTICVHRWCCFSCGAKR
jgi:hypothetical protein